MKELKKRIVSAAMAALLVMSLVPASAYAAAAEGINDTGATLSLFTKGAFDKILSNVSARENTTVSTGDPLSTTQAPLNTNQQVSRAGEVASTYTLTIRKDATTQKSVTVYLVNAETDLIYPSTETPPLLSRYTIDLPAGETMTIEDLVTGLGLAEFKAHGVATEPFRTYLFDVATSGPNRTNPSKKITSFTYDQFVSTIANTWLCFYYVPQADQAINIKAVNQDGTEIPGALKTIASGDITEEAALNVIGTQKKSHLFSRAELRNAQNEAVVVEGLRRIGDYYYASCPNSAHSSEVFKMAEWTPYLVFDEAFKLTVEARNTQNGNNTINGTKVDQAGSTLEFTIPKNGSVQVDFEMDKNSRLTVTESTAGFQTNTELFSSKKAGYQQKTATLTFSADQYEGDRVIKANFEATASEGDRYWQRVDWDHYSDNYNIEGGNYHGATMTYGSWSEANGVERVDPADTQARFVRIANEQKTGMRTLEITHSRKSEADAPYVVDTVVVNGQTLNLPVGWGWQGSGTWGQKVVTTGNNDPGLPTGEGVANTVIYDSKGNKVADAQVTQYIEYANNSINTSITYVTFSNVSNYLEVNRINLAPNDFPGITVNSIGEGLNAYYQHFPEGDETNLSLTPGFALYPRQESQARVLPEFGYYVSAFAIEWDGKQADLKPNATTSAQWQGEKFYQMKSSGSDTIAIENYTTVNQTNARWIGAIDSAPINYNFVYHVNPDGTGDATQEGSFRLDRQTPASPQLAEFNAQIPTGDVFIGWALKSGAITGQDIIYKPGDAIPRSVFLNMNEEELAECIEYGTTGTAGIHLYPVFTSSATAEYKAYKVLLSYKDTKQEFSYSDAHAYALLNRDTIMAQPEIKAAIEALGSDAVLDHAKSDSYLALNEGETVFILHYRPKNAVTLTINSKYGFEVNSGQEMNNGQVVTSKTASVVPELRWSSAPRAYDDPSNNAVFVGWSTTSASDIDGAKQLTDLTTLTVPYVNTTYYAVYAENSTVTFVTNFEETIDPITVVWGESITLPTPVRQGYTFNGWFSDEALTNHVGAGGDSYAPTGNITLYASWTKTEVPETLIQEHLNYVSGREGVNGERYIAPNENVTRGEVAAMLFRMLSAEVREQYRTTACDFPDVIGNEWFIEPVATLTAMGAIKGNPDGTFAPYAPITRAELITINARLNPEYADDGSTYGGVPFEDVDSSHWAYSPISFVVNRGGILGDSEGNTLRPDDPITRAEVMAMFNRVLQRLPETEDDLIEGRIQWIDNQDKTTWYYLAVEEATNNHECTLKEDDIHEKWTSLKPNITEW